MALGGHEVAIMARAFFLTFLLLSFCAYAREAGEDDAIRWLTVVDDGQYEESWSEAAEMFRAQVSRSEWYSALTAVRSPLGAVLTRSLVQRSEHTNLPGAPEGDYVVLVYRTDFASKSGAQETVTLALSGDSWRVAGYFIK